jgi:hypothetical protein
MCSLPSFCIGRKAGRSQNDRMRLFMDFECTGLGISLRVFLPFFWVGCRQDMIFQSCTIFGLSGEHWGRIPFVPRKLSA